MIHEAGLETVEVTYFLLLVRAMPDCQICAMTKCPWPGIFLAQELRLVAHRWGEHQLYKPKTLQ